MNRNFIKIHGAGNDFVLLDGAAQPAPNAEECRVISARSTGIGCDQIMLLLPQEDPAHLRVDFFNADGSMAGACGNGTRCAAWYYMLKNDRQEVTITVGERTLHAWFNDRLVWVNMGLPDTNDLKVWNASYNFTDYREYLGLDDPHILGAHSLSMGNPHLVLRLDTPATDEMVRRLGSQLEAHPDLRDRANIGFLWQHEERWRLRVWERGVGETLACGSGVCAAFAVLCRYGGYPEDRLVIEQPGGQLLLKQLEDGIALSGPVELVFSGEWYG